MLTPRPWKKFYFVRFQLVHLNMIAFQATTATSQVWYGHTAPSLRPHVYGHTSRNPAAPPGPAKINEIGVQFFHPGFETCFAPSAYIDWGPLCTQRLH